MWAGEGPGDRVTPAHDLAEADSTLPDDDANALDGVVRSIGDHARTVNLTRAAGLERALDDAAVGRLVDGRRHAAAELAHQLVGSAGTFGFAGVSDLAAELERFFADGVYGETQLATARAQLGSLFSQLHDDPDY